MIISLIDILGILASGVSLDDEIDLSVFVIKYIQSGDENTRDILRQKSQ